MPGGMGALGIDRVTIMIEMSLSQYCVCKVF